MDFLKIFKCKI